MLGKEPLTWSLDDEEGETPEVPLGRIGAVDAHDVDVWNSRTS